MAPPWLCRVARGAHEAPKTAPRDLQKAPREGSKREKEGLRGGTEIGEPSLLTHTFQYGPKRLSRASKRVSRDLHEGHAGGRRSLDVRPGASCGGGIAAMNARVTLYFFTSLSEERAGT